MAETLDVLQSTGANAVAIAHAVAYRLFGNAFDVATEATRGRFYLYKVALRNAEGEHCGLIELGGHHTVRKDLTVTCRVELTGGGCRVYESSGSDHAQRWSLLASLLGCFDARITRIDLAADDFKGEYPLAWARDQYEAGAFDNRGQKPKARLIDDMGNNTGKTLYIGTRASEKQLRVYEKGKEQGDEQSPWVRYECEFHASNRKELPLEMMTDPASFLRGAYDVLDFVSHVGERIRTTWESVTACAKRAAKHFSRQYGGLVNALLHVSEGDADQLHRYCVALAKPKLPAWCHGAKGVFAIRDAIQTPTPGHVLAVHRASVIPF